MRVDLQLLHLIMAYPQYTDINTVDEHDVSGLCNKANHPLWHRLIVKHIAAESTKKGCFQSRQVASKQCALRVGKSIVVLALLLVKDVRVHPLCWEGKVHVVHVMY